MNFLKKIVFPALVSACFSLCVPIAFAQSRGNALSPSDPTNAEVRFRIAFWTTPKTPAPLLYVKDGKTYKPFQIYEMVFRETQIYRGPLPIVICRKASAQEAEARKNMPEIKKADIDYIPYFTINPHGLNDIGILVQGDNLENLSPKNIRIFDYREKTFPYGTLRIANFSGKELLCNMLPRGQEPIRFKLKNQGEYITRNIGEGRQIFENQFAVRVGEGPRIIYSAGCVFYGDSRTLVFISRDTRNTASNTDVPHVFLRTIREVKPLDPEKERNNGKRKSDKSEKTGNPRDNAA